MGPPFSLPHFTLAKRKVALAPMCFSAGVSLPLCVFALLCRSVFMLLCLCV
jgi:hypothetical protein